MSKAAWWISHLTVLAATTLIAPHSLGALVGTVLAEDGSSLPGAQVVATHPEGTLAGQALTDPSGRFELDLPAGRYRLSASLEGFTTEAIDGVEITHDASALARVEFRLDLAEDLIVDRVQDPGPLPAPSLDVAFELVGAPRLGQPIEGLLRLTNNGTKPLTVPTRPARRDGEVGPQHLALNAVVTSSARHSQGEERGFFSGWFYCSPEVGNCRQLEPTQTLELAIPLWARDLYTAGVIEARRYLRSGQLTGTVSVDLVLPRETTDAPMFRTRPIETTFDLEVAVEEDLARAE